MLKKYQKLIYSSNTQKQEIHNQCIRCAKKYNPGYSVEEIENALNSNKPTKIYYDFIEAKLQIEGQMLFDKSVIKFGNSLWNGSAWKNKTCDSRCPFGNACQKEKIQIDGTFYCYGQLYQNNITYKSLYNMSKKNHYVSFVEPTGEIQALDFIHSENDTEKISSWFFGYTYFIWWFGDYKDSKSKKINGENVIAYL